MDSKMTELTKEDREAALAYFKLKFPFFSEKEDGYYEKAENSHTMQAYISGILHERARQGEMLTQTIEEGKGYLQQLERAEAKLALAVEALDEALRMDNEDDYPKASFVILASEALAKIKEAK